MADLTVLINSSDGFEDCWSPFFTLFRSHWPDCRYPLLLNTERKSYRHAGLQISSSCVGATESRRLTWSECLMRCLDTIDTPFVLYLQEDYFLEAPVLSDSLELLIEEMRAGRADVIRVMECSNAGPWSPTRNPLLWSVDREAQYLVSLQAALWRKSTLRSLLRAHESPWQLEIYGSRRARRSATMQVHCVNRAHFSGAGREILPYTPTGVVKGRWERSIVEGLFARHGIDMNFAARGFYDRSQPAKSNQTLIARALAHVRSLV